MGLSPHKDDPLRRLPPLWEELLDEQSPQSPTSLALVGATPPLAEALPAIPVLLRLTKSEGILLRPDGSEGVFSGL